MSRPGNERRPQGDLEATETFGGVTPILRLRATVSVNLAAAADDFDVTRRDRHALEPLDRVPSGAHVRVAVGSRRFPAPETVARLRAAAERLDVEITSDSPEAVRAWHAAILGGAA